LCCLQAVPALLRCLCSHRLLCLSVVQVPCFQHGSISWSGSPCGVDSNLSSRCYVIFDPLSSFSEHRDPVFLRVFPRSFGFASSVERVQPRGDQSIGDSSAPWRSPTRPTRLVSMATLLICTRLYNATARTTLSSTYRSITLYAELFQETWL